MKRIISPVICLFTLLLLSTQSFAQAKIKIYFTQPVDNSVAKFGVNAVYLSNDGAADTIAAYISRAKSTIDFAIYDCTNATATDPIINALNTAASKGVTVRCVYDESEAATIGSSNAIAHPNLSSSITLVGRPASSDYIMHDKYIIIDATSTNAVVCTGSEDWSSPMLEGNSGSGDYNNILFIQDQKLAQAYETDFDQMIAGTFGPSKTDKLSTHTFTVGGSTIDLYFSPYDNCNSQIVSAMSTAGTDLYVGMYTFTESTNSSEMCTLKGKGVTVYAILDQFSSSMYSTLSASSCLGSNAAEYTGSYIYHNKFEIIDPNDPCSDPQVETGSENWTSTASDENDENVIIIHNDTIANIYYQSFYQDFKTIKGSSPTAVSFPASCKLSVPEIAMVEKTATVYPNPTNGDMNINYSLSAATNSNVEIYNIVGQKITSIVNKEMQEPGDYSYSYTFKQPGMYFVQFTIGQERFTKKVIVTE